MPFILSLAAPMPSTVWGQNVGLALRQENGELIETLLAKDSAGKEHVILQTPTAQGLALPSKGPELTALKGPSSERLFASPPTLRFTQARVERETGETLVTLQSNDQAVRITKTVAIPDKGNDVRITLTADFAQKRPLLEYFLASYAFDPDGKSMSRGGRPDSTFSPGLRKGDNQVVGDHFFRSPAICAQKGRLAAILMPDVDVLADNRPMETILDLDCKNGVVDAPLMSYGFCGYKLVSHVAFAHDHAMTKRVPNHLELAMNLVLTANAEPYGAYQIAADESWKVGAKYFDKILPQAMPYADYANLCYPAAFDEYLGNDKVGWFQKQIDGQECGGVMAGWGYDQGWVSWQSWFNNLRSAWGMHWWGEKLAKQDWVDKSNEMLNLALAAPMKDGACPTTYLSRENGWKGSLITPRNDCYYDLTNMAWKGIWLLEWLTFADCPRKDEILKQCQEMAACMIKRQNADGSFPSWLDKDLNPVPILDHSAQSALPAWFLARLATAERGQGAFDPDLPGTTLRTTPLARPSLANGCETIQNLVGARAPFPGSRAHRPIPPGEGCCGLGGADEPAAHFFHRSPSGGLRKGDSETTVREAPYSPTPPPALDILASAKKAADFLVKEVVNQQRYYDFETFFSCSPKACHQVDGKQDDEDMRDPHTLCPPQNTLSMQWTAEALRNVANLTGDKSYMPYALKALDMMCLYQCVWPISYRHAAYVYGGFGVQNSDGEYNDARQAQFGATLCDFGAQLGREDLFERGVAATRASLTLINCPLHAEYGIYPDPNYPLGLEPENCGHGGSDEQDGRTGFDWGEGSGLTSMAYLLDKYGSTYDAKGWSILVDGGSKGIDMLKATGSIPVDPTFDFKDERMKGWEVDGDFADIPTTSRRMDFGNGGLPFVGTCEDGNGGYDDGYRGTITSPRFRVTKSRISLLVGGGSGKGEYVELIDAATGKQLSVEHGRDREQMDRRTWDVSALRGRVLQIRIVDSETGGWGHINVGDIRCE